MFQTSNFNISNTKGAILTTAQATDTTIFVGSLALLVTKYIFQCVDIKKMKHTMKKIFYKFFPNVLYGN